jgi:hypothetical protein|tara:strand:+ start:97 stop:486 length:390 start_codon:yes stop_codon:yes gene_type:complete
MDERTKLRSTYNKLGSFLVFVTSTFNLMYIAAIAPQDAVWYGAVSGAFTHTILAVIAEAAETDVEERPRKASSLSHTGLYPVPQPQPPMAPQMPPTAPLPQQQYIPPQQPSPVPGIDQAARQVEQELNQ